MFKLHTGTAFEPRLRTGAFASIVLALALFAMGFAIDARADDNNGPVRMARFSYLNGGVTWHYGSDDSWSNAAQNMPVRQGAQIWTNPGGRGELQFDDGSVLRLDSNTLLTLQTLYSDQQGEFTEITLNNGNIHLHLKSQYSIYQVNTPAGSMKAAGPARVRISAGGNTEFEVFTGNATVEGNGGKAILHAGNSLILGDPGSPYRLGGLQRPDDWDSWNSARDARLNNQDNNRYVPSNIALVCDDLNTHGNWHHDRAYGWVWAPTAAPDWRPYSAGSWTWVPPFGWTWVSNEPWGWAPYHYGTWIHAEYGWAWVPGPSSQYWCPAVVSFSECNGGFAWVPLAPREVRYPPALSIGFRSGNWAIQFSIGGTAVYYPGAGNYCEPRPWTTRYVNNVTYVRNVVNVTNVYNSNTYVSHTTFVASNARFGGGSFVNGAEFASGRSYQPVRPNQASMIFAGRAIGAPASGQRPAMGPQAARPTQASFSPTRAFAARPAIPPAAASRVIYRAALPAAVPKTTAVIPGQRFASIGTARTVPPASGRPGTSFTPPHTSVTPPHTGGAPSGSAGLQQYLRDRAAGHPTGAPAGAGSRTGAPNPPAARTGQPTTFGPGHQTGGAPPSNQHSTGQPANRNASPPAPRTFGRPGGSFTPPSNQHSNGRPATPPSNQHSTGQPANRNASPPPPRTFGRPGGSFTPPSNQHSNGRPATPPSSGTRPPANRNASPPAPRAFGRPGGSFTPPSNQHSNGRPATPPSSGTRPPPAAPPKGPSGGAPPRQDRKDKNGKN